MTEYNIKTKTSGKCRVYPDSPNGKQPSVTSICGALMKYGLIQWSADCAVGYIKDKWHNNYGENIEITNGGHVSVDEANRILGFANCFDQARFAHNQIKDEAADFGTLAHLICQLWLEEKDAQLKIELGKAPDEAIDLFNSFMAWANKNQIEPVHTEIKLHGDGYSGRCDLIAYRTCPKTGVRRLGLYDIKTGKGSYYPEWGLQLAAYADAYTEEYQHKKQKSFDPREGIEEIGIIKLNKDTLKCNFSENRGKKFTKERPRLTRAWNHLVKFYWEYNNLEEQFKETENEKC